MLFAALVGVAVRLLAGGVTPNPSPLLGWMLVVVALIQLPIMFFASLRVSVPAGEDEPRGHGARRAALSTSLLSGVLLATSAWFLALALAAGQVGPPSFVLLALVMLSYSGGVLAVGRLGGIAASEVFEQPENER